MKHYDFIIAGGGAAGLSLAFYLSNSSLADKNVLIIDKDRKDKNDRTWGFWHNHETAFDQIVSYRFGHLDFYSTYFQKHIPLNDYRYSIIRGIDFYNFIKDHLKSFPNFEFIHTTVKNVTSQTDHAQVVTDEGAFRANWIFSSIFDEQEILKAASSNLYLRQHFKGWVIESEKPVFNPESFTMFDFRTPQEGLMRFFYIIPHSPNRALVEYTLFSEHLLEKAQYDRAIRAYIHNILNLKSFEITDEEFGVIPMTDYRFPARQGERIINIGSLGGNSKPSSGYTFMRIQKHVQQIVQSLEQGKTPVVSGNSSARYRFYDAVLLNILKNRGGLSEKLFSYMFKNNTVQQLFRFLDEKGGLINDLKIISSLPPGPFLKSTLQLFSGK